MWDLNKVNSYSQYWSEVVIEVSPRSQPCKTYLKITNGVLVEDDEIAPILYADANKAFEAVLHKLKELYPDEKIIFRKPPMIDVLQVEEALYYLCHCRVLDPKLQGK